MSDGCGRSWELGAMRRVTTCAAGDRHQEEIELLDHEAEGDRGDAGTHPGQKCSFIGGMITVATDHESTSWIACNGVSHDRGSDANVASASCGRSDAVALRRAGATEREARSKETAMRGRAIGASAG